MECKQRRRKGRRAQAVLAVAEGGASRAEDGAQVDSVVDFDLDVCQAPRGAASLAAFLPQELRVLPCGEIQGDLASPDPSVAVAPSPGIGAAWSPLSFVEFPPLGSSRDEPQPAVLGAWGPGGGRLLVGSLVVPLPVVWAAAPPPPPAAFPQVEDARQGFAPLGPSAVLGQAGGLGPG